MVDFTLTDEQTALRELAHDFAEKEIRPVAWEYDRDGSWPPEIIDKAHEVGLTNVHVGEEYGGSGLSYLDGCIIEEEIAWGCSGIGTSLSAKGLAAAPVHLSASDEVKKEYFEELVESPKLASFCLTEPDAGHRGISADARPPRRGARRPAHAPARACSDFELTRPP